MSTRKHTSKNNSVDEIKKQTQSPTIELSDIEDFVSPNPLPNKILPESSIGHNQPYIQKNYHMSSTNIEKTPQLSSEQERDLIRYNHISYVLYLLSFFTAGLTWIIPVFMNYYKRKEADGTWLATHFDWQLKTFWYQFLMLVLAGFMAFFGAGSGIGWIVGIISDANSASLGFGAIVLLMFSIILVVFSFIWHLYRIVKGWIALSDRRAI